MYIYICIFIYGCMGLTFRSSLAGRCASVFSDFRFLFSLVWLVLHWRPTASTARNKFRSVWRSMACGQTLKVDFMVTARYQGTRCL